MRTVTARAMRRIDERATKEFGIPSLILMENAGAACAREVLKMREAASRKRIAVFCGRGNNGGDGFAAARHLFNKGLKPLVFFFQNPSEMKPDPLTNFGILQKMKVELFDCSKRLNPRRLKGALGKSGLVVDALFGTGLSKEVTEPFKTVIRLINESKLPVVSVDVPSGFCADTGRALGACVRARVTVALGLPKKGFCAKSAGVYTGRVVVADISIPRPLLV